MGTLDDDHYRYIEHLQQQSLTPDWEIIYDASRFKSWVAQNGFKLRELAEHPWASDSVSAVAQYEKLVSGFDPATKFELPTTKAVFQPIFDRVRQTAEKLGLNPIREVELATSTDITPSPAALPTTAKHLLFIGLGTSAFCNYWAKVITAVVTSIPAAQGLKKLLTADDVQHVFRADPRGIALAGRLALHYAFHGTTIGFGELSAPNLPYRMQLVHSMETFAVAHEYAHFVAEERFPLSSSALSQDQSHELELFCDALGIALARECGSQEDNFLGFASIGALAFLWAEDLSQAVRRMLLDSLPALSDTNRPKNDSTHPASVERIRTIKTLTMENTAPDQRADVEAFFDEYQLILETVRRSVIEAVTSALQDYNSARSVEP